MASARQPLRFLPRVGADGASVPGRQTWDFDLTVADEGVAGMTRSVIRGGQVKGARSSRLRQRVRTAGDRSPWKRTSSRLRGSRFALCVGTDGLTPVCETGRGGLDRRLALRADTDAVATPTSLQCCSAMPRKIRLLLSLRELVNLPREASPASRKHADESIQFVQVG